MRPEDLNPDIISHRAEEEESIFSKKGDVFRALAEAMDIGTSPVRLAELSKHPHSAIRATIAQNPLTPFFALFQALGDEDFNVRQQARYTLVRLQKDGKLDLSDKAILKYVLKYEKDNLKAIEAFEDLKSKLRPNEKDD